ncbi:distal tail protein Dit, partial [Mediterraneibacter gnavus]
MYEFVDTNQAGSKNSLPSEALQIDGEYIENLIDGYRTLYVTGRELLGSEISEREIDLVDGSEYTGKRDTTRSITVGYQLLCTSPREFQEKFNKLSGILNKEQAKLIFADEPDKYFIGTKSSVGDVEPGRLNVKSEFTFYCCDPRKYSAAEKSFTAHQESGYQTLTIVNGGTEFVPVSYDITHNHENGFIGIASKYGAIQLGKIEEADGEDYKASEILSEGYS